MHKCAQLFSLIRPRTRTNEDIDFTVHICALCNKNLPLLLQIYPYVLDRKEHHLNIRTFDENTRREVYEQQQGICPHCQKHFDIEFMEADHITPWSKGGRTVKENCQMLCQECNRRKSAK